MSLAKTYLGDGLYIELLGDTIALTAEDGIEVTNAVYLEPQVLVSFRDWLKRNERYL